MLYKYDDPNQLSWETFKKYKRPTLIDYVKRFFS